MARGLWIVEQQGGLAGGHLLRSSLDSGGVPGCVSVRQSWLAQADGGDRRSLEVRWVDAGVGQLDSTSDAVCRVPVCPYANVFGGWQSGSQVGSGQFASTLGAGCWAGLAGQVKSGQSPRLPGHE